MPQKIGLFGGTFDPVHRGHLGIAKAALETARLDEVRFLPCKQSPHKIGSVSSAAVHRLTMLKLALAHFPWAKVDPFELKLPLPSYSYRTAESFSQNYPEAALYWIMGTDQWQALERWTEWRRLASLVHFIVFQRGEFPIEKPGIGATFIPGEFPVSATAIRNGENTALSIPSVSRYRYENGL